MTTHMHLDALVPPLRNLHHRRFSEMQAWLTLLFSLELDIYTGSPSSFLFLSFLLLLSLLHTKVYHQCVQVSEQFQVLYYIADSQAAY